LPVVFIAAIFAPIISKMDQQNIIRRLSIIKLLYKEGVEQSLQSEATSFFSILSFHDSIDMFLNLAIQKLEIQRQKNEKIYFADYWDKIPNLPLKEQMLKLNEMRNSIKHKGIVPGRIEIETTKLHTTEFFEQNTPSIFEINFNEISLFDLLKFDGTKKYLKKAQQEMDNGNMKESAGEVAMAFVELMHEYKETKVGRNIRSGFDFIEKVSFSSYNFMNQPNKPGDRKIEDAIKHINKNFENIGNALTVIALGVDYKKYIKFKALTPHVQRSSGGQQITYAMKERNWSQENCQFLIDFVVDSGLKLQEFDFDISSITDMN